MLNFMLLLFFRVNQNKRKIINIYLNINGWQMFIDLSPLILINTLFNYILIVST